MEGIKLGDWVKVDVKDSKYNGIGGEVSAIDRLNCISADDVDHAVCIIKVNRELSEKGGGDLGLIDNRDIVGFYTYKLALIEIRNYGEDQDA